MADYYSLIKKAVARLDPSAPRASRQAIYERARVAQLAQLRSMSPSLAETDITREQLALEGAMRRVEAEFAGPIREVQARAISDLVMAADEIGRPISRAESRSPVDRVKAFADANAPAHSSTPEMPMAVRGDATARMIRYWRWRALPPRSVTS